MQKLKITNLWKLLHELVEATVFLTKQCTPRNSHIFKEQLRCVLSFKTKL